VLVLLLLAGFVLSCASQPSTSSIVRIDGIPGENETLVSIRSNFGLRTFINGERIESVTPDKELSFVIPNGSHNIEVRYAAHRASLTFEAFSERLDFLANFNLNPYHLTLRQIGGTAVAGAGRNTYRGFSWSRDFIGNTPFDVSVYEVRQIGGSSVIIIDHMTTPQRFEQRNEVGITGFIGNSTDIHIPSEIQGLPVTTIRGESGTAPWHYWRDAAFANRGLTSVTIPDSITTIGSGAFAGNRLTSVTIPNSVTSIGRGAFAENQLTSVTISNSVTSIGREVFAGNQLTSIIIPNSVTSIGQEAFAGNRLTSVIIPNSVTSIGQGAFAGNRLTSVIIPNSVTSVGDGAFSDNPLTSITIGSGIDSINENTFSGSLRNVTRISIGANVNLLGTSEVVWRVFRTAYEANGARAGVYTFSNGIWNWQLQ
jgi:hypothetical protein